MACSVHPEILKSIMLWKKLSILKAPGGLPKCLSQSSRLSASGDAGESTGKCCMAHGLVPQLPAQFQYNGWLSPGCMHVKSGLWQLWKVIICSKGYTQDCCFHQYPRHTWFMARHILSMGYPPSQRLTKAYSCLSAYSYTGKCQLKQWALKWFTTDW